MITEEEKPIMIKYLAGLLIAVWGCPLRPEVGYTQKQNFEF